MPTTAEVEARLRRTAAACEPLVDDLMTDAPGPSPITPIERRRGARAWLAAAALVVVLAVAAAVVLAVADDPEPHVQAEEGTTTGPPTTDPPASTATGPSAPRVVEVTLPDGTHLRLGMPGPGRWSRFGTQSLATVDGVAEPVLVDTDEGTLAQLAEQVGGAPVISDVRPGVSLVTGEQLSLVVLERDGWTVSLTVAAAGNPGSSVPPEIVDELAAGLAATTTSTGVFDITAPGLTITRMTQLLRSEPVTDGDEASTLAITRDVGPSPSCPADLDPATERCIAGLQITALGAQAVDALPDIAIGTATADLPEGTTSVASLELAMLDGSTVGLGLPEDRDWDAAPAEALITVPSTDRPLTVEVHSGTIESWTSENGSPIEPTETPGVVTSTLGDDRVMVVQWADDRVAVVLVQRDGEAFLTPLAEQRLGEALVAVPEVGWISGHGIDVVSTTSRVLARDREPDTAFHVTVGASEICAAPGPTVRCLYEGNVAVEGETSEDMAMLDELEVGFSPIG